MAEIAAKQVEEIAWALKTSGKHFLWVMKESEKDQTVEFIDSVRDTGLIVPWCNQVEVMANPAVGCFVTHCGWNSTLEGLSLGLPMVAVPRWSDQHTNAKFVEEIWKVGVRAKRDEEGIVRRYEIEMCIREVMDGNRSEEIKSNGLKWKEFAKRASSNGGSSNKNIDEYCGRLVN